MFSLQSAEGVLGHGQWWRLGTCHFMHIHPAHLAINMMSLWHMREIEEDFGKARYLCVYAASCISCSLLSLWRNPRQSVGASGEYSVLESSSLEVGLSCCHLSSKDFSSSFSTCFMSSGLANPYTYVNTRIRIHPAADDVEAKARKVGLLLICMDRTLVVEVLQDCLLPCCLYRHIYMRLEEDACLQLDCMSMIISVLSWDVSGSSFKSR